ncbi:hypothetical protein A0256_11370 [Mucilaginibacter sp. PAMC 26640]|nr:hypothetical protein A0256_11370 [Mucilaginibacter sp. PAMC 26640]
MNLIKIEDALISRELDPIQLIVFVTQKDDEDQLLSILGEYISLDLIKDLHGYITINIKSQSGQVFPYDTGQTLESYPPLNRINSSSLNQWTVGYDLEGQIILKLPARGLKPLK